jgi:hypothetical protein
MTIEIQKPELEALLRQRMESGGYHSVEDVLLQVLKSALPASELQAEAPAHTGADLVAAMQSSPYREISIEPARGPLPVRGVSRFASASSLSTNQPAALS